MVALFRPCNRAGLSFGIQFGISFKEKGEQPGRNNWKLGAAYLFTIGDNFTRLKFVSHLISCHQIKIFVWKITNQHGLLYKYVHPPQQPGMGYSWITDYMGA